MMYEHWRRLFNLTEKEIRDRIQTYKESKARHGTAVFCVNCGSTNLDQNSISELQCYNCGQIMAWNGLRFSIARPGKVGRHDASQTFERLAESSYDEWHRQIEDGIGQLVRALVADALDASDFSSGRLEKLEKVWESCKRNIDTYFQDRRETNEVENA